jgi:hypothetical protein
MTGPVPLCRPRETKGTRVEGSRNKAEALRQGAIARDLRLGGEKLLEIAELQRRRRMALRLGATVRRTSSDGSRVKFATGPADYCRTADVGGRS